MAKSRGRSRLGKAGKKGAKLKKKKSAMIPKQKPVKLDNAVPAICSECFGDYAISTAPKSDRITCPTCGHVGLIQEGVFGEIGRKRQNHKKTFLIALVLNAIACACILAWGLLNSWPMASVLSDGMIKDGLSETTSMVLLGGGAVFLLAGFFMIHQYERSRVEVYF